jgi:hypothetical protein
MQSNWLIGKRVHIVGSAIDTANLTQLHYAHLLVKHVTFEILQHSGGGLVVTVGGDPVVKDSELAKVFDWSVLEVVDCHEVNKKWPKTQGAPVIAVGFENCEEKIPANRKELWNRLLSQRKVELHLVPSDVAFGGKMRQMQSEFGDLLVTIGGSVGVHDLARLYQANKKPIIPLNLSLCGGVEKSASETLSKHVVKNWRTFFDFQPAGEAITAYSRLSLKNTDIDVNEFACRLVSFTTHLAQPTVFYVRLLNRKLPEFASVENYFRKVVDPITSSLGYTRFEMETDSSDEPFMNVELFRKLQTSSLVIADISGTRPNCFLELGYALGLGKKIILTAVEGTEIPWDTTTIHCHFWSPCDTNVERIKALKLFLKKNINRAPIIHQ